MAISDLVPNAEAEQALLDELHGKVQPQMTGQLVNRAIEAVRKRRPQLTDKELQRLTPSGTKWWPGYFRYALDRLRKNGDANNPARGCWEISPQARASVACESEVI